jgi:hypothetical protein
MLRIVDAPEAVRRRGYPGQVTVDTSFVLVDPDVPDHAGPWRLRVGEGHGSLERLGTDRGLPTLHQRGLALAYAGAGTGVLLRAGLLDRPLPDLDIAFAGQPPQILDYF